MRVIEVVYKDGTRKQFKNAEFFFFTNKGFVKIGEFGRVTVKKVKKVGFFWWINPKYDEVVEVDEEEEKNNIYINVDCVLSVGFATIAQEAQR